MVEGLMLCFDMVDSYMRCGHFFVEYINLYVHIYIYIYIRVVCIKDVPVVIKFLFLFVASLPLFFLIKNRARLADT